MTTERGPARRPEPPGTDSDTADAVSGRHRRSEYNDSMNAACRAASVDSPADVHGVSRTVTRSCGPGQRASAVAHRALPPPAAQAQRLH